MAEIKMDISEYEEMKKNQRLLKNSLEKERELQEEIKKLTDEKTKALEDAQKKVVKIVYYENIDEVLLKKDSEEIYKHLGRMRDNMYYDRPPYLRPVTASELKDIFFEKKKTHSITNKHVTTYGLEEIENELRKELKEELEQEIKNNFEYARYVELKNKELKSNIDSLKKKNGELFDKIKHVRRSLSFIIDCNFLIKRKDIKKILEIIEKEKNE